MTEKRINKYRVHLQEIEQKDGTKLGKSIEFQFEKSRRCSTSYRIDTKENQFRKRR